MTITNPDNPWSLLAEFIKAGKTTPQTQMRFDAACATLRRQLGGNGFKRSLFRTLQKECGLASFADVGEQFGFSADEIPVDELADTPDITSEIEEAGREYQAAMSKLEAARRRQDEAEARIARIEELKESLPHLKDSLSYLEAMPERINAEIDRLERSVSEHVYGMPKYNQVGDSTDFVLNRQQRIEAAKAALAAHPARIKFAQEKLENVRAEIQRLKQEKKKEKQGKKEAVA
jgi:hypothetical protein